MALYPREAESGYAQGYATARREERRRFELLHDLLLAMESREAAAGPYGDEPPREDYAETMASLIAQARNVIGDPREMGADRDRWRQECWQILLATGADPDGDDPRHLSPGEALRAVRELLHEANLNDERERLEAEAIPEADRG